jgi:hypothetical protein
MWEKNCLDKNGLPISIFYGSKRVHNETFLLGTDAFYRCIDNQKEPESPFKHFEPRLIKTGIFIHKFFLKWSWPDIATKYEMSVTTAQSNYHAGKKRLLEVLAALDSSKPIRLEFLRDRIAARSGAFTRSQRWYLMAKAFDLTPAEIAKYEGLHNSKPVYTGIQAISDQIAAGELILFESDREQVEAARSRLKAKRARDRRSYRKRYPATIPS